jgi:protein-disulfide isomerase
MKLFAKSKNGKMLKVGDVSETSKWYFMTDAVMQAGVDNGIRGTPGFLINGELLSGAQPFSAFKTIIDAALEE